MWQLATGDMFNHQNNPMFMVMKWLKKLSVAMVLFLLTGCASDNLEKMIPADATGVVSFDVPHILEVAGMKEDDNIVLPQSLQQAIDNNDTSPFCIMLCDLPQMGINTRDKAYIFFTDKTFARVLVASLDDSEKARKTLTMRVGGDFQTVEGLNCMYVKDNLYVVNDDVLLIGTVNKPMDVNKVAKAAKLILSKNAASIADNNKATEALHQKTTEINVWIQGKGLKGIFGKSEVYRELSQKMPLIGIFTESDIDAVTCNVDLDEKKVKMITKIIADDDSEYVGLLHSTLGEPDSNVLSAIPNSMDYIFMMSVKGEKFVKLQQIQQLLEMFGKLPYIGRIDLANILSTVDGPICIGLARDPHLEGEWNMVVAIRSTDPDGVVDQISSFANSMGQAPEIYDGEYIYQYENKMIRIGVNSGILYLKMLDYEQTEGYAYEIEPLRNSFEDALIGAFAQNHNDSVNGYFDFTLKNVFDGEGYFYTSDPDANAALELVRSLCAIKVSDSFGNEDDDDDAFSSFMSNTFDNLQSTE